MKAQRAILGLLAAVTLPMAGCQAIQDAGETIFGSSPQQAPQVDPDYERQTVPEPINYLLPKKIQIHAFTAAEVFDKENARRGVNLRIRALDSYGDATKAFGSFRFELHEYKPGQADPQGELLETWRVDLLNPETNWQHWERTHAMYEFKLESKRHLSMNKRYILVAVFSSPFTDRLFDDHIFDPAQ